METYQNINACATCSRATTTRSRRSTRR
jgi:hypothetical protein